MNDEERQKNRVSDRNNIMCIKNRKTDWKFGITRTAYRGVCGGDSEVIGAQRLCRPVGLGIGLHGRYAWQNNHNRHIARSLAVIVLALRASTQAYSVGLGLLYSQLVHIAVWLANITEESC